MYNRNLLHAASCSLFMLLVACSGGGSSSPAAGGGTTTGGTPTGGNVGATLSGKVSAGRMPISGSAITAYMVDDITGTRAVASMAMTDSSGSFSLNFNCPANSQVYVGASSGSVKGGVSNAAINLIDVAPACAALANGSTLNIDEATTVAAAYALAGTFFNNTGGLAANPRSIAVSFAVARTLVDSAAGTTFNNLGGQAQTAINTLANSLAACIASSGPGSTSCSNLFSAVTITDVSAPTDTLSAAVSVAYYPLAVNAGALFGTATQDPVYSPAFSAAPADWSLQLQILRDAQNTTYQGFTSDQFSWFDSSMQPRAATLAHNDSGCNFGSCGGELRDFQYMNCLFAPKPEPGFALKNEPPEMRYRLA